MPARPRTPSTTTAPPPRALGKLLSEHRAPRSLMLIALLCGPLFLLLGLGMFAGAFDPDPAEPVGVRILLALAGAGFGAGGAAMWLLWRRKRATLVQLYEGGLVETVGAKRREIAWGDVLGFQHGGYAQGLYRLVVLKVELRDGGRLSFNSQHLEGLEAISERLEREVTAQSLPAMRERLRLGQAVSFGKVAVSPQGVHYRKRVLPWADVATAQVRQGYFEVLMHGEAAATLSVHVPRLQRVEALLALVHEQRRRAGPEGPFAASRAFAAVRRKLWLQSLMAGPLLVGFLGAGVFGLYCALESFDLTRGVLARDARNYLGWAVASCCLGVFIGLGWWHSVSVHLRRQRLARRLGPTGKLVPVLVLEKALEELSFHTGWRYRYLTPAGFEATDKLEVGAGSAVPWPGSGDHLLALCSSDERESLLISASGYPLARLPAAPNAS